MQRIDGVTAAAALPAPTAVVGTPGYFTGGDPTVPVPPTQVSVDWLNMVQEEIVAVILGAGMPLSKTNRSQMFAAIQAIVASGGVAFASDAETVAGVIANKAVSPHGAAALTTDRIAAVLGNVAANLNTLAKLAAAIGGDPAFAQNTATALAARALASRVVATSGLATGGGDGTNDRTINVPAASTADYVAGTSAAVALTPAALAGGAGSNQYGYWTTLPGGFLQQWGRVTILPNGRSSNTGTITFPKPFAIACDSIVGNADDGPSSNWRPQTTTFPGGPSLNGAVVLIDSTEESRPQNAARIVWWQAIGR